jgi:hypothetical protein
MLLLLLLLLNSLKTNLCACVRGCLRSDDWLEAAAPCAPRRAPGCVRTVCMRTVCVHTVCMRTVCVWCFLGFLFLFPFPFLFFFLGSQVSACPANVCLDCPQSHNICKTLGAGL